MTGNYKKLFGDLSQITPPANLHDCILLRIDQERKYISKRNLFFSGTLSVLSFIIFILAFQFTVQESFQMSFYNYIYLMSSDGGILISYWREFILSLVESVSLLGVIILGFGMIGFLGSFKLFISNLDFNKRALVRLT